MNPQNAHDPDSNRPPSSDAGRSALPAVDAAIERLIASAPLRRPSEALDARIGALLAPRQTSWWMRIVPLAAAASFTLAIGFVAGSWSAQARLTGGAGVTPDSRAAGNASDGSKFVLRDSSVVPAALAQPTTFDLGADGAVRTIPSIWLHTERFVDPERGVTIERTSPQSVTLVGSPSAD